MYSQKKQEAVASDDVPRGLDTTGRPKPFTDIEPDEGPNPLKQPEAILWLAVIDRAICDYVCPTPDICIKYRRTLDSFFYDNVKRPCNLAFICNLIFDDDAALEIIRKRVTRLKSNKEELMAFTQKRYALRQINKNV